MLLCEIDCGMKERADKQDTQVVHNVHKRKLDVVDTQLRCTATTTSSFSAHPSGTRDRCI